LAREPIELDACAFAFPSLLHENGPDPFGPLVVLSMSDHSNLPLGLWIGNVGSWSGPVSS